MVLVTSPEMQPVLTAISLLLQKVAEEDPISLTIDGKFTVPDGAADTINGEAGAGLQTIMSQSTTQMALAPNPFKEGVSGVERDPEERVLSVTGTLEGILNAGRDADRAAEDPCARLRRSDVQEHVDQLRRWQAAHGQLQRQPRRRHGHDGDGWRRIDASV